MSRHRHSIHRIVACALVAIAACTTHNASAQTSLCCPADLTADTQVGPADLTLLLSQWGGAGAADLDGDGAIGARDLAAMLGAWGQCPSPCLKTRVVGTALFGDGTPAANAVVVTDLGGAGVAGAKGAFAFVVDPSPKAQQLTVAAMLTVDGVDYLATRVVDAIVRNGDTDAGVLTLAAEAGCPNPAWQPTFGSIPGLDMPPLAMVTYDDGSGPKLYAAGGFAIAGGVPARGIARWDGHSWSTIGDALGTSGATSVQALAVHDDGTGSKLYAGGDFTSIGGVAANGIACWNGNTWSALGEGFRLTTSYSSSVGVVRAIVRHDDGSGPKLFAAGAFTSSGSQPLQSIARWDGVAWSPLGSGLTLVGSSTPASVRALISFDDGFGARLYAGGDFNNAGGAAVISLARWNGSNWSAYGSANAVSAFAVYDAGSGPALFVAGRLQSPTYQAEIGRWNGSNWTIVGTSSGSDSIDTLGVHDSGSGSELYAGGNFSSINGVAARRVARWNGSSWAPLAQGVDGILNFPAVRSFASHDDGHGMKLYVGGGFLSAGGQPAKRLASWDGTQLAAVGAQGVLKALTGAVYDLALYDAGSGPKLYATGRFSLTDPASTAILMRLDDDGWTTVAHAAMACSSPYNAMDGYALAVHDDGSGEKLYLAGDFCSVEGVASRGLARWDGQTWTSIGGVAGSSGLDPAAIRLLAHNDGSGTQLYVAGTFDSIGGVAARGIARWNGQSWSSVGGSLGSMPGQVNAASAYALAIHDDGSGPKLFVGGNFTKAGTVAANRIARWDGAAWSALGSGFTYQYGDSVSNIAVFALASFDDGSGKKLYAGGRFARAGGVPASGVARWNGSGWTALGSGTNNEVQALTVHDDGSGPMLYVGGAQQNAGGINTGNLSRWNGTSWSPVGNFPRDAFDVWTASSLSAIFVLKQIDLGEGPSLLVGGWCDTAPGGDAFLARWGCSSN